MTNPVVSVIIAVYNGAPYLGQAIASASDQSYRPIELLVVDDGSTDGSGEIARTYPEARVLRQSNQGLPTALNTGTSAANGDFLAFLDADDLWPPNRLQVLIDRLRCNPDLGYVCGRVLTFMNGTQPGLPDEEAAAAMSDRAALSLGCMLVRTEVFLRVGSFDTRLVHNHDVDWVNRAKEAGVRMEILPVPALHRRIHASNLSRQNPQRRRSDFLRAIKLAMDRRRAVQHSTNPRSPAPGGESQE